MKEIEIKDEAVDEEIIIRIIPAMITAVDKEASKIVDVFFENISGELYSQILANMFNRELKESTTIKLKGLE